MLNKVIFIGRLTANPEVKTTLGKKVKYSRFSIAIDRNYTDEDGNRITDFINCVAWRSSAEFLQKHFSKGKMIGVEGKLHTDSYTDDDGIKRSSFEIQTDNIFFTEGKGKAAQEEGYRGKPEPEALKGTGAEGGWSDQRVHGELSGGTPEYKQSGI